MKNVNPTGSRSAQLTPTDVSTGNRMKAAGIWYVRKMAILLTVYATMNAQAQQKKDVTATGWKNAVLIQTAVLNGSRKNTAEI